eukprot:gnl/MRDRNA2_/MRDRNA2_74752_c0_seq1.p1 gnl/MRDRNA2_/MRDRNA2_74752_c0~~gnl/MRDRNA2_/MRDRNA2_74752_c0_seq1.p1  ORF type:complete len:1278 (+),score=126.06 gnl/MRDRNA2_/MRDRNA2_74752_c0_seq1:196-4029(+)
MEAKYGGKNCTGFPTSVEGCSKPPCPVHCSWSQWSDFNQCSMTCGLGTQQRVRNHMLKPLYGGSTCLGGESEVRDCQIAENCPIDCVWGDWSEWSRCSTTCGGGEKVKRRDIAVPASAGGSCMGTHSIRSSCSLLPCAITPTAYTSAPRDNSRQEPDNFDFQSNTDYYYFATIDNKPVGGQSLGCQADWMALPQGWELAPRDNAAVMIALRYCFETACVVLSNGDCIRTHCSDPPGTVVTSANGMPLDALTIERGWGEGELYRPKDCVGRMLIRKRNMFAPQPGEGMGRYNYKDYKGKFYATLDDIPYSDGTAGKQYGYLSVPAGWEVATRTNAAVLVIAKNSWGANTLVLANGDAIRTQLFGEGGKLWNSGELLSETVDIGDTAVTRYKPKNGNSRVLIVKDNPDYSPRGPGLENFVNVTFKGQNVFFGTIDDSSRSGSGLGYQHGYLALPSDDQHRPAEYPQEPWVVAQYTDEAVLAAEAGGWDTCKVCLGDGTALYTTNENVAGLEADTDCLDEGPANEYKPKEGCMRVLISLGVDTSPRRRSISHIVTYKAAEYATLDDRDPDATAEATCQQRYMLLPSNDNNQAWEIAPQFDDSIHVTESYFWGSHGLVMSDKHSRYTERAGSDKGRLWQTDDYTVEHHRYYKPVGCNAILLRLIPDQAAWDDQHQPPSSIEYAGITWAVMDGADHDETTKGCHRTFKMMPSGGWEIAPDQQESRYIAENYPWGTDGLVFNTGQAVYTQGSTGTAGEDWRSAELITDGSGASRTYKVGNCNERILIWQKPADWVNPPPTEIFYDLTITKGAEYSTLDNTAKDQTRIGCQRTYRSIPSDTRDSFSWEVAKDNSETMSIIDSYPWGTNVLVIAGGKAIRTSSYAPAGDVWNSYDSGCLDTSGDKYKPCCCSCKVLLRRLTNNYKGADPLFRRRRTPTNKYWYEDEKAWFATLDDTTDTSTSQGCQDDFSFAVEIEGVAGYVNLPVGWQIAPAGDGSKEVAASACWGTNEVIIKAAGTAGNAVRTGCANNPGQQNSANSLLHVDFEAVRWYKPNSCNKRILIMKEGPGYLATRRRRRRTATIRHNGCDYAVTSFIMPDSTEYSGRDQFQVIPPQDGDYPWTFAPVDTDATEAAQAARWGGASFVLVGEGSPVNSIGIKTQHYNEVWSWSSWISGDMYWPGKNFYWIWSLIDMWIGTGQFHNRRELVEGRWKFQRWDWWVHWSLPWETGYPSSLRRRSNEWTPTWWGSRILIRQQTASFQAHRRRASQKPWYQNAHHSQINPDWWR